MTRTEAHLALETIHSLRIAQRAAAEKFQIACECLGASSIAKRKREWVRANKRLNAAVTAWNDFASCDVALARRAINDNPIRSTTAERLNLRGYYAADWE
jgi:hypothetical protein